MDAATIKSFSELKKRISWFLSSSSDGRDEVRNFIFKLESFGQVAIFGGMLRDLSICGNGGFKSDIDLVIKTSDLDKLKRLLRNYCVTTNKFGGYRIKLNRWDIDLWAFERTWAFQKGLVEGTQLKDLCKTTFFDWDSIIYELSSDAVHTMDGYIDKINSRFLDINLVQNPNPRSNVIKTLRYHELYKAKLSTRLANYVSANTRSNTVEELVKHEQNSHKYPILNTSRTQLILNSI